MQDQPDPPDVKKRIRQAGRSANRLLMIEYFMRQYPTLSEGLSKLVDMYESERRSRGSSET